jgi:MFS family permease
VSALTSAQTLARTVFASLDTPNYRRYLLGQVVSLTGTWMQTVAQGWLVLQLTGSGTALGVVIGLQTLPVLLLGPAGGLAADRLDKRRLLMLSQSLMGLSALTLGVLTLTGVVALWHVYVLALVLGLGQCVDNPTRQAFVMEMVGQERLRNAVTLNSVTVNAARAVGPAIAAVIIAAGSLGLCFVLNAVSFAVVVLSLATLDRAALLPSPPAERSRGQLREGLRYVARTPELGVPLLMMALVGCLAYEFQVVLPVVAEQTFAGGADTYGLITSAQGVGAIIGGLYVAARGSTGTRAMVVTALGFGASLVAAAAAPTLPLEIAAMTVVGAFGIRFLATSNSTLQLAAAPTMRGRVMALWTVCMLGSTPIGGPIAGAVVDAFGGRSGLALGAAACLVAAVLGAVALRRAPQRPQQPVME